jgi:hypothetical protein
MRVIGLRSDPRGFTWAISEGSLQAPVLVAADYVQAPSTFSFAEGANFLRMRLRQLVSEHHVTVAGLRTPETVPRATESFRERLRIEGALLAACAEAGLSVTQGPLVTLSRLLGVKSAKVLLESDDYQGINLSSVPKEKREAILMSVSLLKSEA